MKPSLLKIKLSKSTKFVVLSVSIILSIVCAPFLSGYLNAILKIDVRFIDIDGIVSDKKIDAVNRQLANLNFAMLTIEEVKFGLEDLPWVHQVNIRKIWPDRMQITIEEEVPLAQWNESQYLNSDSEVFISEFLDDHHLPYLRGPKGTERLVMWQFQKLNSVIGVTGQTINSLSLNDRGGWSFILGDISIRLGKEDILERMRRFLRLYREVESTDQLAEISGIDTRYPNGVAVNWIQKQCQGECYAENNRPKRDMTL